MRATVAERFWSKVAVAGPDDCWLFKGQPRRGYGRLSVAGRRVGAHVQALIEATGEQPAGRYALHSCDNPPCVNPLHLRWGTQAENIREAYARGRKVASYAPRVLTPSVVAEIRARYAAGGISQYQLAAEYGVVQPQISNIIRRRQWVEV